MTTGVPPATDAGPSDTDVLAEPRLIAESGLAARVAALAAPVIGGLGFRLVRVRILALDGCTVQIMAERPDGSMSIGECEALSRAFSPVLDVAGLIERAYRLEISSPGLDRPLVRCSDFRRHVGEVVKVELSVARDGRRRFRGRLAGVDDAAARIIVDGKEDAAAEVTLPFSDMADAKVVLTDELIAAALRRSKAAAASGNDEERDEGGSDGGGETGGGPEAGSRRGPAGHSRTKNKRASGPPASGARPDAQKSEGE